MVKSVDIDEDSDSESEREDSQNILIENNIIHTGTDNNLQGTQEREKENEKDVENEDNMESDFNISDSDEDCSENKEQQDVSSQDGEA